MSEVLCSVGLDVGTTSTQMVVSQLVIENRAGSFAVPEMEITGRKICYKSPVYFTPLLSGELVDGGALREIVDAEYQKAGITKDQVDTGAVIITGETSRKENAGAVLEALSDYAGDFVVATAGPDLESVLAAKGAGAVEYSTRTGKRVLHMDIGGGTSNLALIEDGRIVATGCMNVGGRLLKIEKDGRLTYVSPVLAGIFLKQVGDYVNQTEVEELAELLAAALETAAGLADGHELAQKLWTAGAEKWIPPREAVISFSGGVADCIGEEQPWLAFGDMGPELGRAIRRSKLCKGQYVRGKETIRATVIGAGSHSAQLSGSTVFYQNVDFPMKNLPVARLTLTEQALPVAAAGELICQRLEKLDGQGVLALPGLRAPGYQAVSELAEKILAGWKRQDVLVVLEEDMAKALGQQLALKLGSDAKVLCIDRVRLAEGSYLDVGAPVAGALPVVVKTLILSR